MSRLSALPVVCLFLLWLSVWADEPGTPSPEPGFRPGSEHAAAFLDALDETTIAVYPTIVRRANRTAHSLDSRAQIIALLDKRNIAASPETYRVNLGALAEKSQWDTFLNDRQRISEYLEDQPPGTDYHLFMAFMLPASDDAIFGIHCYILDAQGNNAFSFLLNSHFQLFNDASLVAEDSSEQARSAMMTRAAGAAIGALEAQIAQAQEPAVPAPDTGPGMTSARDADYPINELPMYGLREKTPRQKRADKKYIRTMTKGGRTRAEAAEMVAQTAWNIFYSGDKSTAIKRFNQAWLLDPENQLALWGFAVTCMDRGQVEEAVRYYRMAIDAGPENLRLQGDYEIALSRLAQ